MPTPLDTVTLVLSGEVHLNDFAKAIDCFHSLIKGLSAESGGDQVRWVIQDLEISSTVATVKGIGEQERVEKVVRAYAEVGTALEADAPIPYSPNVIKAARGLKSIVDGRIESVRFETPEREIIIRKRKITEGTAHFAGSLEATLIRQPTAAFGSIEGRVQTLTNRGELRFTLYDLLNDKAISCYLQEGREEVMRGVWGKLAVVTGWITRDPITGRPLSIRRVESVIVRPEETGDYRDARGIAPSLTDLSPEAALRRLRDA